MSEFKEQLTPHDVIAAIIIIGCFVLIFFGKDGFITATLSLMVGYYFGTKIRVKSPGENNE